MYLLDAIINGDTTQIIEVIVMFTVPFLIITLVNVAFSAYDGVAREKMYVKIINEFLQRAIDLDLGYFDDTRSYDKYNRAFNNCCNTIDSIHSILSSFITSVFNVMFIVGLLVWMDIYMFLVIVIIISISFFINNKLKKMDYNFSKLFSEKNKQVNYLYRMFYIPQFVREVKSNNLDDFIFDTKQGFNDDIIKLTRAQAQKKAPYKYKPRMLLFEHRVLLF